MYNPPKNLVTANVTGKFVMKDSGIFGSKINGPEKAGGLKKSQGKNCAMQVAEENSDYLLCSYVFKEDVRAAIESEPPKPITPPPLPLKETPVIIKDKSEKTKIN